MNDDPNASQSGGMMKFKRTRNKVKMDPAFARRQGDIVGVAMAALGSTDAVMDFLNGVHPALDARPLEIATQSQAGFDTVRNLLAES